MIRLYYFFIIDKKVLRPDDMTSRAGFGPRTVVWRPLVYLNKVLD